VNIGTIMTTRTSKRCLAGFAAIVALQSSGAAFASSDCDPTFEFCCSGSGDPHYRTIDGVRYDFQSAGEFVFLQGTDGLEIQTRQTPVVNGVTPSVPEAHSGLASCVSVSTAVAMRLGTRRVSYEPKWGSGPDPSPASLELRVDGKLETLGPSGLVTTTAAASSRARAPAAW
jgi:lysyl endopeptidase